MTFQFVDLAAPDGALRTLVIGRRAPPYKGRCALPRGFVMDETLLGAPERQREDTGVGSLHVLLEQLGT